MPAQGDDQVAFKFLPDVPVVVQRHAGQITSDAGLLPVRQFDQAWRFTERLAACLTDALPDRVQSLLSMVRQRVFGIIAGYEDCNDHDLLRDEPVFKMIADRSPEGDPLASQPTLSRFENGVTDADFRRLVDFTVATGVERLMEANQGELPASVTLDLTLSGVEGDATDEANARPPAAVAGPRVLRPVPVLPADHLRDDHAARAAGAAPPRHGPRLAGGRRRPDEGRQRDARQGPDIKVHVRGDAGFGLPLMYDVCEANGLTSP